jgi:orotidine-5'-phosphate decarboxylase
MARKLAGVVGMFKTGKQLFTAEGPRAVEEIAKLGPGIFLDLKFHDIPNTVAGAVAAAAALPAVRLMTVHTTGGAAMMRAAVDALPSGRGRPHILGVTLLTSLDERAMLDVGLLGPAQKRVVRLAQLAKKAGLDGVVASPLEVQAVRRKCGRRFLIVTPGVRPANSMWEDQARVATPAKAIQDGADYVVVGRPITESRDPRSAAESILEEIRSALRRR